MAQSVKNVPECRRHRRRRSNPWVGKIPWRSKWQPIPVFLPGKSHGQRSLVGYNPWDYKSQTRVEHVKDGWMDGWMDWKMMPSRTFIAREEKSVTGFKASKERLTFLLGANITDDFRLKSVRIMLNLLCLCFINKAWRQHIWSKHCLLNILSPTLRSLAQKQRFLSNITAHWKCTWSPTRWWVPWWRLMSLWLLTEHPFCGPLIKE